MAMVYLLEVVNIRLTSRALKDELEELGGPPVAAISCRLGLSLLGSFECGIDDYTLELCVRALLVHLLEIEFFYCLFK